jgi:hypothetical protein
MAERKSAGSGKVVGASAVEAEAPAPAKAPAKKAAPKRIKRNVGGHVVWLDPEPPAPEPIDTCSICGHEIEDGACPNHPGGGGWGVVTEQGTPRSRAAEEG